MIVVAFYYPPNSREKTKLMDHLVGTCHAPLKEINDRFPQKPWITFELKKLDKLKKSDYRNC